MPQEGHFTIWGWPTGIEPALRAPQTLVLTATPWPPYQAI